MSDKDFKKLNPLDQMLRSVYTSGMIDGTRLVIRMVTGFEIFNTRPYHNYETWGTGYEATDGRVYARAEDLDDCIRLLCEAAVLPDDQLKPWQRGDKINAPAWVAKFDAGATVGHDFSRYAAAGSPGPGGTDR